jgi:hypothetical protein
MSRPKGCEKTPGSGRKKGSLNRRTLESIEAVAERYSGLSCVQRMLDLLDTPAYKNRELDILMFIMPYCHSKMGQIDPNINPGQKTDREILEELLKNVSKPTSDRPENTPRAASESSGEIPAPGTLQEGLI